MNPDAAVFHPSVRPSGSLVSTMMDSSDDVKDAVFASYIGNETSHNLPANSSTKFVDEVLNGPNECCLDNFRMDKHIFYKLCGILHSRGLLRHTNKIKIEEQIAIFMFIIGHNLRTRAVQELFRYSGETISRHFNNVLNAIITISLEFFQPPESNVPLEIFEDPKLFPYFKDCVGAVDGIHIPVMVGVDEQGPFRNKNGVLSQNVLAACSFDMKFHYVLAGWEGSATDVQVLVSALTRRNKLSVPEGKYYLVDSKYANMPGFMAPYSEELKNELHQQVGKELFTERHTLLRNVSVRTFGALKARFPILMTAPPYPLQTQVKLIVAACAIHNYIRKENPDDWIFKKFEQHDEDTGFVVMEEDADSSSAPISNESLQLPFDVEEHEMASQLRDSIADNMWCDYIHNFSSL